MAFTELYIQASGSSAVNGGSGQGAAKVGSAALNNIDAVQTSGRTHTLENKDADGWGTTAVGDFGVFDVAGAKNWFVVVELTSAQVVTVDSMAGTASIAAAGKAVNIGGSWPLLSDAAVYINATTAALWALRPTIAANPPRLNVAYQTGTAYAQGNTKITFTSAWTQAIPLTIEGYSAAPGDLDWTTTTVRPYITFTTDLGLYPISAVNVRWLNLYFASTSTRVLYHAAKNAFYNCKLTATGADATVVALNLETFIRCELINASVAASSQVLSAGGVGVLIDSCTIKGGAVGVTLYSYAAIRNSHIFGCGVGLKITTNSSAIVFRNNVVADCSSHGLENTGVGDPIGDISGNLFAHNGGYAMTYSGAGGPVVLPQDSNAFYGNAGDVDTSTIIDTSVSNLTLAAEPFVETNAANRQTNCDYEVALDSAVVGAGLGVPPQGTTYMRGRPSIGALQFWPDQGVYPDEADVDDSVTEYGPNGDDYAGSLDAPSDEDIAQAVWEYENRTLTE